MAREMVRKLIQEERIGKGSKLTSRSGSLALKLEGQGQNIVSNPKGERLSIAVAPVLVCKDSS